MVPAGAGGVSKSSICVGCGLTVNGFGILEVDLADPGSGLLCDNTTGLSLNIQKAAGSCVDLAGLGTTGSPLQANINLGDAPNFLTCDGDGLSVNISGAACNGIRAEGNNLYAPCPDSYACSLNVGPDVPFVPFGINTAGAAHFDVPAGCVDLACSNCVGSRWQVTNPSPCCTMEGFISALVYGGLITGASVGFDAAAYLMISINGGAFTTSNPPTFFRMTNQGPGTRNFDIANMEERNFLSLAASASLDIQIRVSIDVFAGTATWSTAPVFEYYVHMTQVNCGCAG